MNKIFVAIFSLACLALSAQNVDSTQKLHEFSLGAGYMQMMTSSFLPSGLPAVNITTDYKYFKQGKKLRTSFWDYWLKFNFAFLQPKNTYNAYNDFYTLDFMLPKIYSGNIEIGGTWYYKIPFKSKNFSFFAGVGILLNTEVNFALEKDMGKTILSSTYSPHINWFLSPDLSLKANWKIKKVTLSGEVLLPLAAIGNYTNQFYYLGNNIDNATIIKTKLKPNTFVFLNKIFAPTISLSSQFFLKQTDKKQWFFLIKYTLQSLDINLKNFTEKKELHNMRLGFVCVF